MTMQGQKTAALVARMKEPSTWAGLSALLVLFGLNVEQAGALANAGAAIAGLAAVFLGESK